MLIKILFINHKYNLTKSEISLFSRRLRLVPTPHRIRKDKLKHKLELFWRNLRLLWHFWNEERTFDCSKNLRPKSTSNPKNKGFIKETYLNSLEEKLLHIDIPKDKIIKEDNLIKRRDHLHFLENDTIAAKSADKGSRVVAWERKIIWMNHSSN